VDARELCPRLWGPGEVPRKPRALSDSLNSAVAVELSDPALGQLRIAVGIAARRDDGGIETYGFRLFVETLYCQSDPLGRRILDDVIFKSAALPLIDGKFVHSGPVFQDLSVRDFHEIVRPWEIEGSIIQCPARQKRTQFTIPQLFHPTALRYLLRCGEFDGCRHKVAKQVFHPDTGDQSRGEEGAQRKNNAAAASVTSLNRCHTNRESP